MKRLEYCQPIRRIQGNGRFTEWRENLCGFGFSLGNHTNGFTAEFCPEGKGCVTTWKVGDPIKKNGGKISRLLVKVKKGGKQVKVKKGGKQVKETRWRKRGKGGEGDGG